MDSYKKKRNPWLCYETEVPHSRFGDPAYGVSPAEKLSPDDLQLLKNAFTCPRAGAQLPGSRLDRGDGNVEHGMNLDQFREVLRSVMGPDIEDTWVERFFSEVDISCSRQVTWQQLCSYLLLEYTERRRASIPRAALLESQPLLRHCPHNKREPTVRVVAVSHPPPLRYISVSKGGQITVWNNSLHILKSLGLSGDPTVEVANTRRFRGWTTDVVYMRNVHKIAIATDCRDLHFISVSTAGVTEDIHLFGFRSVPTALCYWHDVQCPEQSSLLLLGDERGGVHLMWFLKPFKGLFNKPPKKEKSPQRIFFPDLGEHSAMVSYRHIPNIHQKAINRVMFEGDTNTVMTSSESDTMSVAFVNVTLKQKPYQWTFKQGAKCFDYSAPLQLLVTGGCDRTVRLWTRFVSSRPAAVLLGHRTTVLDVAIYQCVGQIFSYSRDAELRVWDIASHCCLKSICLPFPSQQPGQMPEHGNFPFLLLSPPLSEQPHLVVGCKDYLALLNLAQTRRGGDERLVDAGRESRPRSQGGPALCCALYNSTLRQVATGHADSSVSLWDVETGRKRLLILNAHGEEALTCMTLDSTHRRLITGARNGTIKVWNFLNGLNLHKLEPVSNSKVTGLTCLYGNRLLAVGWSQRIVQYDIAAAKDLYVRADMSWRSRGVHKSDILAVSQCFALGVVATASHDGEVIIWRLETQGAAFHLRGSTQAGEGSSVDSLLFLQHRAGDKKLRSRGVLVTSQAGRLCFWSTTGETHSYGQFYAPEQSSERVLCLSSDQSKNTILVSGDTSGWLQIWDIHNYALEVQDQHVCERPPPMLRRWKTHTRALESVEVLEEADRLFLLTASADGSARLWTTDGEHVGTFGEEGMWNITELAASQRKIQKKQTEDTVERPEGETKTLNKDRSQVPNITSRGQTSQEEITLEASSTRPPEHGHEQPQQSMDICRFMCEDFGKTVASYLKMKHPLDDICRTILGFLTLSCRIYAILIFDFSNTSKPKSTL